MRFPSPNRKFRRLISLTLMSALTITSLWTLPSRTALAFKPRYPVVRGDWTHANITEFAIWHAILVDNYLGVGVNPLDRVVRSGIERAVSQIIGGNTTTDQVTQGGEFFSPAAHFDDEAFVSGQGRLTRLRKRVNAKLQRPITGSIFDTTLPQARGELGRSLHAIQDFYSHTNWAEKIDRVTPNDRLGRGVNLLNVARRGEPTCRTTS